MGKVSIADLPTTRLVQTGPPPNAANQTYKRGRYKGHGDPNGVIRGYIGDEYLDLDSYIQWFKVASNSKTTGWVAERVETGIRNVANYPGAVGDGTNNDSAAAQAAFDELSSANGGELYFPPDKTWKVNLVITKGNVTLSGASHMRKTSATPTFTSTLVAADPSKPVIQVGNDTGIVRGVVIHDISIDGSNGGTMGVYFAGGAFECGMRNCAVVYFDTCIKVQGGSTYQATLIYFDRVDGHPDISANNARGWMFANTATYPNPYTSEIVLTNCHWDGPSSGTGSYVMEIDSVEVKMVNTYFDITAGHGVKLSHNQNHLPFLDAVNCNLDAGGGVVIEGYNNDRNFAGLITLNCQINGTWKEADGTIIAQLPQPITTILRKNSAVRGSLVLLNAPGGFGDSFIQFRDQINNKNPQIIANAGGSGGFNFQIESGGSYRFQNISGSTWLQINGSDGAMFFTGAGITASTFAFFDANRQLKSATVTGSGTTMVLSTSPTIQTPTLTGTVVIQSTAGDGNTFLRFADTLNNKNPEIHCLLGFIDLRPEPGAAFRVTGLADPNTPFFQVNGTDGSTFLTGASLVANSRLFLDASRQVKSVSPTITAPGTTGAQTINKMAGRVNFAAGAQTLVVTNSLVTTSSIVTATIRTDDATAKSVIVLGAAGSFTLKLNATATAETAVDFSIQG